MVGIHSFFRRLLYVAGLLGVLLAGGVFSAQAEPAAPATQALKLNPDKDATIDSSAPLVNFGKSPELNIAFGLDQGGRRYERATLIHFDLAAIPPGAVVVSATLSLDLTRASDQTGMAGIRVASAWDESAVTFKDRPGFDPAPLFNQDVAADPKPRLVVVDVTKIAAEWLAEPTRNFGLGLRATTTGQAERVFASREGATPPVLTVTFALPPIRVCQDRVDPCTPIDGARVFDLSRGQAQFLTADGGLVIDHGQIQLNDRLWVKQLSKRINRSLGQYCTSAQPVRVTAAGFQNYSGQGSEFRLAVTCRQPVLLQDLIVSAWYMADDPNRMAWLRTNLILASDYLYDFTEGRMALGTVTVRQNYAGWESADIKLHTNNTLRPNATIGGIVAAETPDIWSSIPISYSPGSVAMGSYWNRFGTPPGEVNTYNGAVVPPAALAADWAIALAHEFGHYLLFLFDTYTDANGQSNADIAALCTGSAMGNAYAVLNQAFVFDQAHWDTACGATEAHARLQGRTEWATIQGWYPAVAVPTTIVTGQRPSGPLTQVVFEPVAPGTEPPPLATSQSFSLTYQANEQSSSAARAFLFRADSRIFDQGRPAAHASTVQLTDARLGDRLCVYDIDDNPAAEETPRHQFGCEVIAAGDAELIMTRNVLWRPEIAIEQTGPQQLNVTVNQALGPGQTLMARVIPEDGAAYPAQPLTGIGAAWSGTFNLPAPVAPLFLQLWADETPAAPTTRREVVVDRGTGGNGAFGPASIRGGVLVVSSDGDATYEGADGATVALGAGESIAWQSMPGTPALPSNRFIAGQSYRLDAHPATLAATGVVSLLFENNFGPRAADANLGRAIYFWSGGQWRKLPTSILRPSSGPDQGVGENVFLANAPSQGVGVYAVLSELGGSPRAIYLPWIRR